MAQKTSGWSLSAHLAQIEAAIPAMVQVTLLPFLLSSLQRKKITTAFDGGRMTYDGGVMLLAAIEKPFGITAKLAALITDPRNPNLVTHSVADILRARMLAQCDTGTAASLQAFISTIMVLFAEHVGLFRLHHGVNLDMVRAGY